MSIALITDGMLYPIVTIPAYRAPDGGEAIGGSKPATPCGAMGVDLAKLPPAVPVQAQAAGEGVPVPPCGTTGSDPTIDPPKVPKAPEASEDLGSESPAVPKCPQGRES